MGNTVMTLHLNTKTPTIIKNRTMKDRVKRVIESCKTRDQLRSAMKYMELAGLEKDPKTIEILWYKAITIR